MKSKNTFAVLAILACILGLVSTVVLEGELKDLVNGRLNKIASDCAEKGVNIGDIEPTISACLDEVNRLGLQEVDHYSVPMGPGENMEEYNKAYAEYLRKAKEVGRKAFCFQLNTAMTCLQPLKNIAEDCNSVEGITLFKVGKDVCRNNGSDMIDIDIERCSRKNHDFSDVFHSCGARNGLIDNYLKDPYKVVDDICGFGSAQIECLLECFQSTVSEPECEEGLRNFNKFIEVIRTGGSEAETAAVTACFFGRSSA